MNKESLEEKIWKLVGLPTPKAVSIVLDNPDIETKLVKYRLNDLFLSLLSDATSAATNYFLGRVFYLSPLVSAGGLTCVNSLNILSEIAFAHMKNKRSYDLDDPFFERAFELVSYEQQINAEISDRGYPQTSFYNIFANLNYIEEAKLGIEYANLIIRPAAQISAAVGVAPPWLIGGTTLLSFSLLPLFWKLGLDDRKYGESTKVVSNAIISSDFSGSTEFKERLVDYRDIIRKSIMLRGDIQTAFSKASLYISALTLPFIETSAFLGIYRFIDSIMDVPSQLRDLKKKEAKVRKTAAQTETLAEIISGEPFLLTKKSWDTYRQNKPKKEIEEANSRGVYFRDFQTKIPDIDEVKHTPPLNLDAVSGKVYLLKAPSGAGKSVSTQLGMTGVVETLGDMVFVDADGSHYHIEDFTRNDLAKRVVYIGQEIGFFGIRVADLFNRYATQSYLEEKYEIKPDSSVNFSLPIDKLTNVEIAMISMSDINLEQQLVLMAKSMKKNGIERDFFEYDNKKIKTDGVSLLYDCSLFDKFIEFRNYRATHIESMLKSMASNLENVKSDQGLGQLSHGQFARIMFEYNRKRYDMIGKGEATLIVFDEITDSLDSKAKREVSKEVADLMHMENSPCLIWISQSDSERIKSYFGSDCVKVNFGEKIYR